MANINNQILTWCYDRSNLRAYLAKIIGLCWIVLGPQAHLGPCHVSFFVPGPCLVWRSQVGCRCRCPLWIADQQNHAINQDLDIQISLNSSSLLWYIISGSAADNALPTPHLILLHFYLHQPPMMTSTFASTFFIKVGVCYHFSLCHISKSGASPKFQVRALKAEAKPRPKVLANF